MADEYSATDRSVQPDVLSDAQRLAIGRIIRACAEIEDIISTHLSQIAEIGEGQLMFFLGRTGVATKLQMAEQMAFARGGAAEAAHRACFHTEAYRGLTRCRNAVAHGLFIGRTAEGRVAFRTATITETSLEVVALKVLTFEPGDFEAYATIAEQMIPQFDTLLRTKALRETRRALSLGPRPEFLDSVPPNAKSARRHQSSQASARQAKLDQKAAQRSDPKNRPKGFPQG